MEYALKSDSEKLRYIRACLVANFGSKVQR